MVPRLAGPAIALALVVAACATAAPSPSEPGSPTAPSSSAEPSPTMTVSVPLDPTRAVTVAIHDESGTLRSARAATEAELEASPMDTMTTQASVSNPEGVPSQTVVVQWGGGICDRAATVHISPSVQAIEIVPAPSPPCDTLYIGRGLVLTFTDTIDAGVIAVSLRS